jgi:hypothetical protein
MIDLPTAAAAAAILNNSVTAIDKVYNWVRSRRGEKPASVGLRNDPERKVLEYVSLTGKPEPPVVVMTHAQFAQRLDKSDIALIKSFERRMDLAMGQWNALNSRLPLASEVERVRIEANMEDMKNRDICASLNEIIGLIERLGMDLHDHYASIRHICR